tara:strand:+ start:489 stop:1085 length:597 start_codon:yes stop_codon:yes gene_type:complete
MTHFCPLIFKTFILILFLSMPSSLVASRLVGEQAPNFTLVDSAGKKHVLNSYRGKTVVLEWTNPKCPFVVRHYDSETMKKLAEAFASNSFIWLAIDSSYYANTKTSADWAVKYGHTYPTLLDMNGKVGRLYQAKTTPHMFVIDSNGIVRYEGAIDSDPWGNSATSTNYVANALQSLRDGKSIQPNFTKAYGCSVKYKN